MARAAAAMTSLLALLAMAVGVGLLFGLPWALIVGGGLYAILHMVHSHWSVHLKLRAAEIATKNKRDR